MLHSFPMKIGLMVNRLTALFDVSSRLFSVLQECIVKNFAKIFSSFMFCKKSFFLADVLSEIFVVKMHLQQKAM